MTLAESLAELELKPGASAQEVKATYRDLATVWHPDRFSSGRLKQKAEAKLNKLNAARELVERHLESAASRRQATDHSASPAWQQGASAPNQSTSHCVTPEGAGVPTVQRSLAQLVISAVRWVLVLPAFLAASFVAHMIASFVVAWSGMGLEEASQFSLATDMQGYWVSGTLFIVLTKLASGAGGMMAAIRVAPGHVRVVGYTLFWTCAGLLLIPIVYLVAYRSTELSFSSWYRSVIDAAALLAGMYLVAKESCVCSRPSGGQWRSRSSTASA